jgi:hypothetical protein
MFDRPTNLLRGTAILIARRIKLVMASRHFSQIFLESSAQQAQN